MPYGPQRRTMSVLALASLALGAGAIASGEPPAADPGQPAQAQPEAPPAEPPPPQPADAAAGAPEAPPDRPITFELVGGGSYNFRSSLQEGSGDVSIVRAGGELNIAFPIGGHSNLVVNPGMLYSGYDFSGDTAIAPGFSKPWSDMWEYRIGANALLVQDRQFSYILGATIDSSGEQGADFADTLTYSGVLGLRCALSESFAFAGGLVVSTRLEDNPVFFPLLGLEWKIDDHWTLSNTRGRVQSEVGTGLALGYRFNEQLELRLSGSYTTYQFRLDDKGFSPGGVAVDSRVPIALAADWNITPKATLLTTVGLSVWQEYEAKNSSGDTLSTVDTNPQPFISFVLSVRF